MLREWNFKRRTKIRDGQKFTADILDIFVIVDETINISPLREILLGRVGHKKGKGFGTVGRTPPPYFQGVDPSLPQMCTCEWKIQFASYPSLISRPNLQSCAEQRQAVVTWVYIVSLI